MENKFSFGMWVFRTFAIGIVAFFGTMLISIALSHVGVTSDIVSIAIFVGMCLLLRRVWPPQNG